ncbi:hypothetical protein C5167_024183 [Papaver somniferum]|uniref:Uncharacterized protein n=1 Tax=Papaver somniferum TaxID=3469 RepID=A0A4Y7JMV3_PAPSO|nr:hypothetical protein C5167_024183 [Papaver somniferum]
MRNLGSSSASSSSSDCSSLVSTLYTTNSMVSFSSNCSSSIDYETRCEGLDLLVKAVVHVAGCFLVVPFTQRRVIRRRKRNLSFFKSFVTDFIKNQDEEEEIQEEEDEEDVEIKEEKKQKQKKKKGKQMKGISKPKRKKRVMALPSKYNDSVLHPWIRTSRRRQSIQEEIKV